MASKFSLVFVLISAVLIPTNARVINLMEFDDLDEEFWVENTCRYMEEQEEYDSAVCIDRDEFPEELMDDQYGFWGPCQKKSCHVVYYGNSYPKPESVYVEGLVGGSGSIKIFGRLSVIGSSELKELGALPTGGAVDYVNTTVTKEDGMNFVINITAEISGDSAVPSFALIDNIFIDLGEDIPEPPPEQTPAPPQSVLTVDTKEDLQGVTQFTEVSCNYAEHIDEFWTWGCPQSVNDDGGEGYWTVCNAPQCNFVFSTPKDTPKVKRITLDGVFNTGGRIVVSKKGRQLGSIFTTLYATEMRKDETHQVFDLQQDCKNEVHNVSISAVNGAMVINKIEIELFEDYEDECNPNIISPPTQPPSTATPGIVQPTTPGSAVSATISSVLLVTATIVATVTSFV